MCRPCPRAEPAADGLRIALLRLRLPLLAPQAAGRGAAGRPGRGPDPQRPRALGGARGCCVGVVLGAIGVGDAGDDGRSRARLCRHCARQLGDDPGAAHGRGVWQHLLRGDAADGAGPADALRAAQGAAVFDVCAADGDAGAVRAGPRGVLPHGGCHCDRRFLLHADFAFLAE